MIRQTRSQMQRERDIARLAALFNLTVDEYRKRVTVKDGYIVRSEQRKETGK